MRSETTTQEVVANEPKKATTTYLSNGEKFTKTAWIKLSGATGYLIQYSTDKSFKKNTETVTAKKIATSKTIKNLTPKKKYYILLRTYKYSKLKGKTVKICSKWSPVKTIKIKK